MATGWRPKWICPFCGSRGFSAFWRWLILGTRKLHICKKQKVNEYQDLARQTTEKLAAVEATDRKD